MLINASYSFLQRLTSHAERFRRCTLFVEEPHARFLKAMADIQVSDSLPQSNISRTHLIDSCLNDKNRWKYRLDKSFLKPSKRFEILQNAIMKHQK